MVNPTDDMSFTTRFYVDIENIPFSKRLCSFLSSPECHRLFSSGTAEFVLVGREDLLSCQSSTDTPVPPNIKQIIREECFRDHKQYADRRLTLEACEAALSCLPGDHMKIVFVHGGDQEWVYRAEVLQKFILDKRKTAIPVTALDISECSKQPRYMESFHKVFEYLASDTHSGSGLTCPQCIADPASGTVVYRTAADLHIHMKMHASEACETCGKVLRSRDALRAHVQVHRDTGDPLAGLSQSTKLLIATRDASREINVKDLVAALGDGLDLPGLICSICGKYRSSEVGLREHEMKHTRAGETYDSFSDKERALNRLEWAVKLAREDCKGETSSAQIGHECDLCGKTWESKKSLRVHQSHHTRKQEFHFSEAIKAVHRRQWKLLQEGPEAVDLSFPLPGQVPLCAICGRYFKTDRGLKGHLAAHARQNEDRGSFGPDQIERNKRMWLAQGLVSQLSVL